LQNKISAAIEKPNAAPKVSQYIDISITRWLRSKGVTGGRNQPFPLHYRHPDVYAESSGSAVYGHVRGADMCLD